MFKIVEWLFSQSAAEKLLAKALVCFEHGDRKAALGNLLDGMAAMAGPGKAHAALTELKADAVSLGLLPAPAVVEAAAVIAVPAESPPA